MALMLRAGLLSWLLCLLLLLPAAVVSSSATVTEGLQDRSEIPVTTGDSAENIVVDVVKSNANADANGFLGCSGLLSALSIEDVDDSASAEEENVFNKVHFAVHRNGDTEACGIIPSSTKSIHETFEAASFCSNDDDDENDYDDLNKYQVESFLTDYFATAATTSHESSSSSCHSVDDDSKVDQGLYGYCDLGLARTVIQNDHAQLVRTRHGSLPCRFYTREGRRVYSLQHIARLAQEANEQASSTCTTTWNEQGEQSVSEGEPVEETCQVPTVHLYAVPAGRVFMFAPKFVGEQFHLKHVQDTVNGTIVLEVVSLEPRVFEIYNFFSLHEADGMIDKALNDKSEVFGLHRSTTGATNGQIFNKRTSENAWDTDGVHSTRVKRRCFDLLGIDEYHVSHADGLQVLRYQNAQAYTMHPDYLTDRGENYNYDSSGVGGNRFATVLLYMATMGEQDGGETVFQHGWPVGLPEDQRVTKADALKQLRESGEITTLKPGSWEEDMTAYCRTRLAIRPIKGRAVLFYSQHPNGKEDKSALHGACPVLNGTKWAANLWVWSGPRPEYENAPLKRPWTQEEMAKKHKGNEQSIKAVQKLVTFRNSGTDPLYRDAKLYFKTTLFGDLGEGSHPIPVNSFAEHEWTIKNNDGRVLRTIVITNESKQEYIV